MLGDVHVVLVVALDEHGGPGAGGRVPGGACGLCRHRRHEQCPRRVAGTPFVHGPESRLYTCSVYGAHRIWELYLLVCMHARCSVAPSAGLLRTPAILPAAHPQRSRAALELGAVIRPIAQHTFCARETSASCADPSACEVPWHGLAFGHSDFRPPLSLHHPRPIARCRRRHSPVRQPVRHMGRALGQLHKDVEPWLGLVTPLMINEPPLIQQRKERFELRPNEKGHRAEEHLEKLRAFAAR